MNYSAKKTSHIYNIKHETSSDKPNENVQDEIQNIYNLHRYFLFNFSATECIYIYEIDNAISKTKRK